MNYIRLVVQKKCSMFLFMWVMVMSTAYATSAFADEINPPEINAQKLWNKSCQTCHGESSDIARNFLKVVDGKLHGPMHKENFRIFLTNHYLSEVKADAVYAMLLEQALSKTRFEEQCGSCHQKVYELVREKLILNNGVLYSKKSNTPTYGFLNSHRNLNKDDIKYFAKKLTFIGYEIYQPVKME